MKILYPIGAFYPSQSGGPNNSVYWMTQELFKHGIQPTIVTTNCELPSNVPLNKWLDMDCGNVFYAKSHFGTFLSFFPLRYLKEAIYKLSANDVIHLNNLFWISNYILMIIAYFKRVKLVISVRGELDEKALVYSYWKKRPVLMLVNYFFKNMLYFHSTCKTESENILNHFGNSVSIIEIPNYMKLPELIPLSKKKYLLFLGRIHPKKGIENLIHAITKSLIFKKEQFTLLIAGNAENNYGKLLMELVTKLNIENQIKFIGHIEGIAKQSVLAEAYCLIMPSHTENFGNVVVEALSQRTPVIASKGTPWKILETKNAGLWVDNDPALLCKGIDKILSLDKVAYSKMSSSAYLLAKEDFNIQDKISDWIDFYNRIV